MFNNLQFYMKSIFDEITLYYTENLFLLHQLLKRGPRGNVVAGELNHFKQLASHVALFCGLLKGKLNKSDTSGRVANFEMQMA